MATFGPPRPPRRAAEARAGRGGFRFFKRFVSTKYPPPWVAGLTVDNGRRKNRHFEMFWTHTRSEIQVSMGHTSYFTLGCLGKHTSQGVIFVRNFNL